MNTQNLPVTDVAKREIPARLHCTSPLHLGSRWLLAVYFYRSSTRKSGLQTYCITCKKAMSKADYSENKSARNEKSRQFKERQRRAKGIPERELKNPTPKYGAGRRSKS